MVTRNRIIFSEKQARLIWQQALGAKLTSTEDEQFDVIYPGRINGDNGPDFRDTVIVSKSRLIKGDVEVHVRSSDWYSHKHHANAEYNNVILHVVMWHDCNSATMLRSGRKVPVLCLVKELRHQAYLLPNTLPCFPILDHMDAHTLKKILDIAGKQRFRQKAKCFQAELRQQWAGQVLFRGIMRALGYAKNTKPFVELADRMPLASIEPREGLAAKQALLLGTAGLLPSQRQQIEPNKEREIQALEQIWQSVHKKPQTMKETDWNLSHIYPNNSPVRRIIAHSYLIERYSDTSLLAGILQLVKDTPRSGGHSALESGLTVDSDGYWRDHFDFGVRSRTKIAALLGHSKAGEITVNVLLPFVFSWGALAGEVKLTYHAIDLYHSYPRLAENCLTQHMKKQLGFEESFDLTACRQQGLIHVFRNYCREGRCSECPLVR
jgi:HPt (histidine-containing phosphotransfer) domain-containing protein